MIDLFRMPECRNSLRGWRVERSPPLSCQVHVVASGYVVGRDIEGVGGGEARLKVCKLYVAPEQIASWLRDDYVVREPNPVPEEVDAPFLHEAVEVPANLGNRCVCDFAVRGVFDFVLRRHPETHLMLLFRSR